MKNIILFLLLSFFTKGVFSETEMISVKEGDSVTLHIGLEIQNSETLTWSLREKENPVIVKIKNKINVTINDDVLDGRFKDRLKPDSQTGDLTITNIRSEHAGVYQLRGKYIPDKEFNISVLADDAVKPVSVMVGDSVTLNIDATQIYDVIRWRFEHQNSPIAEINRSAHNISKYDGSDGRFKHRLELDYLTGSLTIKNIGISHSGDYEVDLISSIKHTVHKTFRVTVSGETRTVSVKEGDSLTLQTDLTEIQREDFILWLFGDIVLAEVYQSKKQFYTSDERFRDRLSVDEKSGSLTITDIRTTDPGLYELKIRSSKHSVHKRFTVTVIESGLSSSDVAGIVVAVVAVLLLAAAVVVIVIFYRRKISKQKRRELKVISAKEKSCVTLRSKIQRPDEIQWMFVDQEILIAKFSKERGEFTLYDGPDERFRNRLKLDDQTGSLTITSITTEHTGVYKLEIIKSNKVSSRIFSVILSDNPEEEPLKSVDAS